MKKYKLGENTTRNLESILIEGNPRSVILVTAVKEFIKETPIDFCIIENGGHRTTATQMELFANKRSRCDGIKKISKHQKGLAVDLVPFINGKPSWHRDSCFYLAGAFQSFCIRRGYDITSGADWKRDGTLKDGWDPCHVEIEEYS